MRFLYLTVAAALLVLSSIGHKPGQDALPTHPWQDVDQKTLPNVQLREQYGPRSYRSLKLNVASLQAILRRAPLESVSSNRDETVTLELPVPDAGFMRFKIEDSPIMEKQLANRYPEIKTYRGQGIDNPTAITRFDWTPFGFHAIILSTRGTILIEPAAAGDVVNYVAYFQEQLPASFSCEVDTAMQQAAIEEHEHLKQSRGIRPSVVSGSALRTYRLAVAATAEYTQTYGSGTVSGALASITTTMNLVNAIYQRELSIRMVLIANEDSIIFTDTATDGYTSDAVSSLISQNQAKLDAVIGSDNYDIGHVFDGRFIQPGFFSFQGQAQLRAVCRSFLKGQGASIFRSLQPFNVYAYYIVAHEMGHQFGASHTFNATTNTCGPQRAPATAYEPGTGSTIMAYRAACGIEDLNSTDTYFHIASLEQITDYTTAGFGTCAVSEATGNNIPTVEAGESFTIPSQTPFILTATGSDPDGDSLTYSWEEFDLGTASPPSTDDGTRPIFRSFAPVTNPARTFPRLTDILSGISTFGESLPTTTRTMNFRVTVRDNRFNAGAVNSDGMQLNVVSGAGPFTISQPSFSTTWPLTSSQTVSWDVANTNQAPVNCANVRILLSLDGGFTFPITLADSTPNDGSEIITVPLGTASQNSRVKVEAIGNVFFNISKPFAIPAVGATFSVSGHIADAGNNPIPAVTITFTKNFQGTITTSSTTTNALGDYLSADLGCPNGVQVTPTKIGYSFSPVSTNFVTTISCLTGADTANFTGTPSAPTPTPTPTPTPSPPTIFVEDGTNNLAALDSVTRARGPFSLTNSHNFSGDQRTRIIFFTTDLGFSQLTQPDLSTLSVQIGGNSFTVEAVEPNSTTNGSSITFRLPDLPTGTHQLGIRIRGVNSTNSPNVTIVGPAGSSGSGSGASSQQLRFADLLFRVFDLFL